MTDLLIIVGAATPPGRLAAAMQAAADTAGNAETINLADAGIEICDGRADDAYNDATRAAVAKLNAAKSVLIAAPVYRASYPGVLKNLLDIAPVAALQNKPVGIVAMGGSPHHYLAVDTQLRVVLAWFGALTAPTSVYLTGGDFKDGKLASEGGLKDMAALVETLAKLRALDPASLGPKPLAARFT
ncbi:MAG TPA: NADPH-dependent FMN reductase [Stellaceae bacterium]|jgi:FMN reductase